MNVSFFGLGLLIRRSKEPIVPGFILYDDLLGILPRAQLWLVYAVGTLDDGCVRRR